MPKGSTKPCPGCGEVAYGRAANAVCHDCKSALAEVRRLREYVASEVGLETYIMGGADHWNPRFYSHMGDEGDEYRFSRYASGSTEQDRLSKAFWALVRILAPRDPRHKGHTYSLAYPPVVEPRSRGAEYSGHVAVRMRPEVRQALDALFFAIHAGLTATYAAGLDKGKTWVQGILDGTYTPEDLRL